MLYFVHVGACKRGCEKHGEGAVDGVTRWGVRDGRQRQAHHFLPFGLPYFPKNVVPLHHDNNG